MMDSPARTLRLAARGAGNMITHRPLCVSFEVTYRCNARCQHCHLGGPLPDEIQAPPERFAELSRTLKPVVAQVSGGEPMLRRDLEDIVSGIRSPDKPPFIVLTTNATRLTRERYERLRRAGVDEFSISFDYPDERHDEFRRVPGLFSRIENLLRDIRDVDRKGITLAGVVHRKNYHELYDMAEFARKWNVHMNFSTYTWLRTQEKEGWLIPEEELHELEAMLNRLREHKRRYNTIRTSEYVFERMPEFFRTRGIPGCRAGDRFFIVNPAGTLSPCGLVIKEYATRQDLRRQFTATNTCTDCYTSIRANTEKSLGYQLRDALSTAFSRRNVIEAEA